jgi:hypothetical protein
MPPDELDTLIQSWMAAPEATRLLKPVPAPGPQRVQARVQQPHRVVWFAAGLVLWQLNGILLYLFLWLLLHS